MLYKQSNDTGPPVSDSPLKAVDTSQRIQSIWQLQPRKSAITTNPPFQLIKPWPPILPAGHAPPDSIAPAADSSATSNTPPGLANPPSSPPATRDRRHKSAASVSASPPCRPLPCRCSCGARRRKGGRRRAGRRRSGDHRASVRGGRSRARRSCGRSGRRRIGRWRLRSGGEVVSGWVRFRTGGRALRRRTLVVENTGKDENVLYGTVDQKEFSHCLQSSGR